MSLLCSCVAKKGRHTPSLITENNVMSSKLRPPTANSGSRFGFSSKPRKQSVPVSTPPAVLELRRVSDHSTPIASGSSESSLTGGLTLDPSALLLKRCDDSLGGYVPRKTVTETKPRPMSSIASLGQANHTQEHDSGFSSFDESKSAVKPKSTLRSLFSRSFNRDKTSADKTPRLGHYGSNNTINNSKSDGSLGNSLKPRGSLVSTGSSSSNFSTDSRSKSDLKRASPIPSRVQNGSPTPRSTQSNGKTPSKPVTKSLQSKLMAKSASSLPKSTSAGLTKTSQAKAKPSRLSYGSSKQIGSAVTVTASSTSQEKSKLETLNNYNTANTHSQNAAENIDSTCYNAIRDAIAPVAKGDTDSENSGSPATEFSTLNGDSLISTRPSRSMSSGSTNSDKRKPMIEINPITKGAGATTVPEQGDKSETSGPGGKTTSPNGRFGVIEEEVLYTMSTELAVLRTELTRVQHLLLGSQEHDDKMREELETKNGIINDLRHELANCTCRQTNGYSRLPDEEILAAAR
ncbi:serine-rich adhesin for platelets-like [Watersipora subatra]|uniref:serine-rich adhesin for platelets-like n=1 Tax=Watersipora subatra TaxID=2589382 RepID=UPI00355BC2D7